MKPIDTPSSSTPEALEAESMSNRWTFFDDAESSSSAGDANLPRLALDARSIDHVYSTKVDPGLSSHAGDLERVALDVFLLLKNASEFVPSAKRRLTPV